MAAGLEEAVGDSILSPKGAGTNGVKVQLNTTAVVDLSEPFLFGPNHVKQSHANAPAADADDGFNAVIGLARFAGKRDCFDGELEIAELFRDDLKRQLVFFSSGGWGELYE